MSDPGAIAVPGGLLAILLGSAIASDIRSRRIPNTLILAGWAIALGWHVLGPAGHWSFDANQPGAVGPAGAVLAGAAMLLVFMPFYLLRIMGAGDVKLMSVVGMFFGATSVHWAQLAGVSLFVLAAGGLLALARMAVSRRAGAVAANLRLIFAGYSGRMLGLPAPAFDARLDSADRMPYALAIATGTCFYVVTKWAGWIQFP